MLITEIKKTSPGRLSVIFQDESVVKSTLNVISDLRLFTGKELDEEQMAELKTLSTRSIAREKALEYIFSKIEWTTIFFFVGLFVLVGGLEVNGIINWLASQTMQLTGGEPTATTMSILWLSAIMSAFVDNIPFVATMIPMVKDMGAMGYANLESLWWALSLGACLGGNGTVIGASANVVALGLARQHKLRVSFMQYFCVGFPLMLMSIGVASIYLWLRFL
jgi:Na+/H+ antiporter NhaD/arsenite permease-like protein